MADFARYDPNREEGEHSCFYAAMATARECGYVSEKGYVYKGYSSPGLDSHKKKMDKVMHVHGDGHRCFYYFQSL